ncbi:MAG: flagellar basal body P-ring formation chaperone FlgA [Gammaproteobacteria bacterium]|nr:flagellar basal body P-ring formation chaperone FlgA [Gammaproteobacteria bacterium]
MLKTISLTFALLMPAIVFSQEKHDPEAIRQQVRDFTQQAAQSVSPSGTLIDLNVGKLSEFLNLQKCAETPELFVNNGNIGQRHVTIGVRCTTGNTWTVYLPVVIQRHAKVLVANRHLRRGQTLTTQDVREEILDLNSLSRGYLTDRNAIVGLVATHNLSNGLPLRSDTVYQGNTVSKGDKVTIAADLQGIAIKMAGEAMAKGMTGELIPVKNLSSNKIIEAEIVRPGVVQIRM